MAAHHLTVEPYGVGSAVASLQRSRIVGVGVPNSETPAPIPLSPDPVSRSGLARPMLRLWTA